MLNKEFVKDLVSGKLVLWVSLYKGRHKGYEMYRITLEQIEDVVDSGLNPVLYGANPNLDLASMCECEFDDRVDAAQGIVWLGDM